MQELIGKKLGQYHIEAEIGAGGMAVVYKARQSTLNRHVALKVLPPLFAAQNPDFIKRFQHEAESIARLEHPNILPVYEFGVDQGYHYIVMRYVKEGKTLDRIMRQSLSQEQAIELVTQIGHALAYAHKKGVVHRDLKPSNVLIADDWPLLSDFGLAKTNDLKLTATGMSLGTPAYMAPEQAQGKTIDQRVDIYALGVILYEMLTGRIPHLDEADMPYMILYKRCIEPPHFPREINPTISEGVEQVMLQALAMKPEDRYNDIADFVTALQMAVAADDDEATIPSLHPRLAQRDSAYNRKFLLIGAILGVIAIGGVGWWAIFNSISSELSSAQTDPIIAAPPTPTATPTSSPTWTVTLTSTSPPPTDTPTPLPSATPTPTNTSFPTLTPTSTSIVVTDIPTATPTTTPSPTPNIPTGVFSLIKPVSCDEPSYGLTEFEWEWTGNVSPEFGFEVRIWREGEPPTGVHDAILDNKEGRVEPLGENRYRLTVDIADAAGVRERSGEYRWTVILIQIDPIYADNLGQQAQPACLRFEAGGKGGSSSSSNGSSGGGGSGGGPVIHD